MPSRKPLKGGAPRLLGNHGGVAGRAFRVAYDTLVEAYGPFSTKLLRFEAARVAVARINLESATRALARAQTARESVDGAGGRRRVPSSGWPGARDSPTAPMPPAIDRLETLTKTNG